MNPPETGMELRLSTLYPDRMNIYADRGNLIFLRRRCAWRGIGFSERAIEPGDPLPSSDTDLVYIGGGQDRDQKAVAEDLGRHKLEDLTEIIDAGKPVLAVCGGFQLMGHSYEIGDERLAGLGLVDMETVRVPGPRLVGNVAIELTRDLSALGRSVAQAGVRAERKQELDSTQRSTAGIDRDRLVGFENHGGRTTLGPGATPLGRVITGHGNNGEDGTEGVVRNGLIGTYLHGPLLPKNWWLADALIAAALERRYGEPIELEPLNDDLERAASARAAEAAGL